MALVSLSFPIRDHHKHHILSNFPRGLIVTRVVGKVTYVKTTNELDKRTVHAEVKIEDITDPDTNTDVTPVKSGITFMRHWVFACKKAVQKLVLKTIQDDSWYKGARWGSPSNTRKGFQSFFFTSQDSLIIDGTDTVVDDNINVGIMARLAEIVGIIAPRTASQTNEEGKNIRHYERGRDVSTNTGPTGFRQIETYSNASGYEDFVELYSR